MITESDGLLPDTLDLLLLKAISLDRLHGYGVLLRIQQISGDAFNLRQGSLYPALERLEQQRLIKSEWGESKKGRPAKYYRLTLAGRRQLNAEAARWERFAAAMAAALRATPNARLGGRPSSPTLPDAGPSANTRSSSHREGAPTRKRLVYR